MNKLWKKVLPLTFLGLSPAAANAAPRHASAQSDDDKNNNKTEWVSPRQVAADSVLHALQLPLQWAEPEYESPDEEREIRDNFIRAYHAHPGAFDVRKIYQLLSMSDDPKYLYEKLNLNLDDADKIVDMVNEPVLRRMGLNNKYDIISHAIMNHPDQLTPERAMRYVLNKNIMTSINPTFLTINTALNQVFTDSVDLTTDMAGRQVLETAMDSVINNPNHPWAIKIFNRILEKTESEVNKVNVRTDSQSNKTIRNASWLCSYMDRRTAQIPVNSLLADAVPRRLPAQMFTDRCQELYSRLILVRIYNQAYFDMLRGAAGMPNIYSRNPAYREIQDDYTAAIRLAGLIMRNAKSKNGASDNIQEMLNKLLAKRPELKLFMPYFDLVYLNETGDHDDIVRFGAELHQRATDKNNLMHVPSNFLNLVNKRNKMLARYAQIMQDNGITMPEFNGEVPAKMSYGNFRESELNSGFVYDKIDKALAQEIKILQLEYNSVKRQREQQQKPLAALMGARNNAK